MRKISGDDIIEEAEEELIMPDIEATECKHVIESLFQPQQTVTLTNTNLAGACKLYCEPCGNTLRESENTCIFCRRTREEIMSA